MITVKFEFRGYSIEITEETPVECALACAIARAEFSRLDIADAQKQTVQAPGVAAPTTAPYEVIKVSEITSETKKGSTERFYKVRGGAYTAYGIPLYTDACQFQGALTPLNFHLQVSEGLMAKIETVGGKKKITAIRQSTEIE